MRAIVVIDILEAALEALYRSKCYACQHHISKAKSLFFFQKKNPFVFDASVRLVVLNSVVIKGNPFVPDTLEMTTKTCQENSNAKDSESQRKTQAQKTCEIQIHF